MDFTFTPIRTLILVVLLVAFYFLGGFEYVSGAGRYIGRAWLYSVAMFVIGAVMVSVVDHWVGNIDRSNIRWLYIFMGLLAMGGGLMYQHVLRERVKIEFAKEAES